MVYSGVGGNNISDGWSFSVRFYGDNSLRFLSPTLLTSGFYNNGRVRYYFSEMD